MGEAFKAGIDAEKLADTIRQGANDFASTLVDLVTDSINRQLASLTREGAAARAANAAKDSTVQ